jgi:hypothetical protein
MCRDRLALVCEQVGETVPGGAVARDAGVSERLEHFRHIVEGDRLFQGVERELVVIGCDLLDQGPPLRGFCTSG